MAGWTSEKIARVTWTAHAGDDRPQCPTWMPSFYIVADKVTAEFADGPVGGAYEAVRQLDVAGDRYRVLKAGPKHVGRGTVRFGQVNWPRSAMGWLVRQMYDAPLFTPAEIARRHDERMAYARQQQEGS